MAGRKRHSAEDIVRKLRQPDALAVEGKAGDMIAADSRVSGRRYTTWGALTAAWTPTPPRNSTSSVRRTSA